jgi:hypothetical protein
MLRYAGNQLWLAVRTHSRLKLFESRSTSIDGRQRAGDIGDNLFQFHVLFRRRKQDPL